MVSQLEIVFFLCRISVVIAFELRKKAGDGSFDVRAYFSKNDG